MSFFGTEIGKGIVVHTLSEIDGIQYLYPVAAPLEQLAAFHKHRSFRVCHHIGRVHLHEIGLAEKTGFATAGAADHQDVFISGILWGALNSAARRYFLMLRT